MMDFSDMGWSTETGDASILGWTNATQLRVFVMGLKPPQPRYFPTIDADADTDVSPEFVERLTLILAGIEPTDLETTQVSDQSKTIRQLRLDRSIPKLSPSQALLDDHRVLLWPSYPISPEDFGELWRESKTTAGGQDATELIKQVNWLRKLKLGDRPMSFLRTMEPNRLTSLFQLSPKILFYLFRSAVRQIDRDADKPAPKAATLGLTQRMLQKIGVAVRQGQPAIYIPDSILAETEVYLSTASTLGRVLKMANEHRHRDRA